MFRVPEKRLADASMPKQPRPKRPLTLQGYTSKGDRMCRILNKPNMVAGLIWLALVCSPAVSHADCSYNGIRLYGDVKVVTSFADIKVKIVDSFPDLKVKIVNSFPDSCGKWKMVDSFPDFKIQFVDSFPDITIKMVDSFPGK